MVAMMPLSIAERDGRLTGFQPADLAGGVLAHLQGRLGQLRQRLIPDERDITDREDPVLPRDTKIGADEDPAATPLRQAPPGDRVRRGHARRPYRDIAGPGAPVGEDDLVGGDLTDDGAEPPPARRNRRRPPPPVPCRCRRESRAARPLSYINSAARPLRRAAAPGALKYPV
jgi:hypothetical protein